MFAKHLPPSAGPPRVLALDEASAAEMPEGVDVIGPARVMFSPGHPPLAPGRVDAVVGYAAAAGLQALKNLLRPGGRLILAHTAPDETLLAALLEADLIHCLVEPFGDFTLYRGERPPQGSSAERIQALAGSAPASAPRFLFLLITQTPNRPAWRPASDEKTEWRAATVLDPATGQPTLLAFSALVKAVAFMQAAILAGFIRGVNKVGKFWSDRAEAWALPYVLNPDFESWRAGRLGPAYEVDPRTAISGEE